METIVTEILEIIKSTKGSIAREERLRSYFEDLTCRAVSEALERIDAELTVQYADKGWHVERLDARTVQASFGEIRIRRRRMKKERKAAIYPLDKERGIRPYRGKSCSPRTLPGLASCTEEMQRTPPVGQPGTASETAESAETARQGSTDTRA